MSAQRVYYYEDDELKKAIVTARYRFSLEIIKDKVVLDIGCGARRGPQILSSAATRVIGCDISYEAVYFCVRTWPRANLSYLVSDARYLPFADCSFDAVTSFEVIEHLDGHERFLREVQRVLKPGCAVVISTPNKPVLSPTGTYSNPDHVIEFDKQDFERALRGYFTDIVLYGQHVTDRVKAIEGVRSANMRAVSRIPRAIKTFVPARLKECILKKLHNGVATIAKGVSEHTINEADFFISGSNIEQARHLIAVCKK